MSNILADKLAAKKLSVIVPVCERTEAAVALFKEYKEHCSTLCGSVEFIYVVTVEQTDIVAKLRKIMEQHQDLTLVVLNRNWGEATAVQAGFSRATGDYILTLPPYKQVETTEIRKLFEKIEQYDIVLGKRWPRRDGNANQFQTRIFNFFLNKLSGLNFSDIGCGIRLIKAEVLREITMYGDQWRFLPLLAYQLGFHSLEVELAQAADDTHSRVYNPGTYLRRLLDLLTIVFLTKFNKKPLRFFGLIGSSTIITGILGLCYLAFERLVLGIDVSDRPLLVLFSLCLVLGVQLIAIGLVGEAVIFTHAKDNKEYQIREIIN